jgi:serine/threonine protein kinase
VNKLAMKKGNLLGDGTYGTVYSCTDEETGDKYAIKVNIANKKTLFLNSIREVDLLMKLRKHPHIVTLERIAYNSPFDVDIEPMKSVTSRNDNIHFIFQKTTHNLYEYIYKIEHETDYKLLKRYMIQILLATEYMHEHSIIHCDLKPSNILIFEDDVDVLGDKNIAQICDFGLSLPYTTQGYQIQDVCTSWYRAPEIILNYPHYDYKSDVWALGCIFFEMIANIQFLAGSPEHNNNLISKILELLPEEIPTKTMRSLVTSNKFGRKIKLFKYATERKTPRKPWLTQLNLSKEKRINFEKNAGNLELFCDLLDEMFQFDWDVRNSVSECINHPFFDDQRDLINETRRTYYPCVSLEKKLYIFPCQERIWVKEVALNIYQNKDEKKFSWYNDRALFQALYLFDRYMMGMFDINNVSFDSGSIANIFNKYDTLLKFYTFLYLSLKYFDVFKSEILFNDVFDQQYRTNAAKLEIEQFESGIVQKMDHDIYRTSVYEAVDNFPSMRLDKSLTLKLLETYLNVDKYLQTTPTEFVRSTFNIK